MQDVTEPGGPLSSTELSLEQLGRRWGWLLALGIVMLVAGFAAVLFPVLATLAAEIVLGAIFLLVGIVEIAQGLELRRSRGFWLALLLGLVTMGLGLLLLLFPLEGIVSLTLVIAILFLISGVLRVLMAWRLRPSANWGWLMLSGVLALILGALVLAQWPEASLWFLGVLVGVDLIFSGWWMVYLAIAARRARHVPTPA